MTLLNQESENKKSLDDGDLLYDNVDNNIVFSVSSIRKHYVNGELFNVNNPYEGFIDLNSIKHIRLGCIDQHIYSQIQLIATTRYSISDFNDKNIINLVYGSSFSENRSLYFIGPKQSIQTFYHGINFLIQNVKKNNTLITDNRLKWLKFLYLSLFYAKKNKNFRNPNLMEALIAFGGQQFNLSTLQNFLNQTISNLLMGSISNKNINHDYLESESKYKNSFGTNSSRSSINKRKSSTSITSFKLKNCKAPYQRKALKSEIKKYNVKETKKDVELEKFIQNKKTALKSKFSKLKYFKNRSLMYDVFNRSSSASLDFHNSFDSDNQNQSRLVSSTKQPMLLNMLKKPSEVCLINPLLKNQSVCSSSGVSTLRSGQSLNPYQLNFKNSFNSSSPPNESSTKNMLSNIFDFKFLTQRGETKLSSILCDTFIEFDEFVGLFKSFYVHMRKDLKELFDKYAIKITETKNEDIEATWQKHRQLIKKLIYNDKSLSNEYLNELNKINNEKTVLTRNNLKEELNFFNLDTNLNFLDTLEEKYDKIKTDYKNQLMKFENNCLFNDLICSNSLTPYSISSCSESLLFNSRQIKTSEKDMFFEFNAINLKQLKEFVVNEQLENLSDQQLLLIIEKHEPNAFFR